MCIIVTIEITVHQNEHVICLGAGTNVRKLINSFWPIKFENLIWYSNMVHWRSLDVREWPAC